MFLRYAEFVVAVLIVGVFVTQVFLPLGRGTPLFPFFRRERRLNARLKEARQAALEKELEDKLKKEKQ